MSISARFENGIFRPLEEFKGAASGEVFRVFSEEELRGLREDLVWLRAAEHTFDFWDNEEDAVYDTL